MDSMEHVDFLGYTAGFLTTFSAAPQLYHSYMSKDVKGISLKFQIMLMSGLLLWAAYGGLIRSWPVILFNLIGFALWLPIFVMKLKDRNQERHKNTIPRDRGV
jgi:MtN3 and saliva related transmembrane protein